MAAEATMVVVAAMVGITVAAAAAGVTGTGMAETGTANDGKIGIKTAAAVRGQT
jgi:hypothetical protein